MSIAGVRRSYGSGVLPLAGLLGPVGPDLVGVIPAPRLVLMRAVDSRALFLAGQFGPAGPTLVFTKMVSPRLALRRGGGSCATARMLDMAVLCVPSIVPLHGPPVWAMGGVMPGVAFMRLHGPMGMLCVLPSGVGIPRAGSYSGALPLREAVLSLLGGRARGHAAWAARVVGTGRVAGRSAAAVGSAGEQVQGTGGFRGGGCGSQPFA